MNVSDYIYKNKMNLAYSLIDGGMLSNSSEWFNQADLLYEGYLYQQNLMGLLYFISSLTLFQLCPRKDSHVFSSCKAAKLKPMLSTFKWLNVAMVAFIH